MTDFKNYTVVQWMNLGMFMMTSLAGAGWFMDFFDPIVAARVAGGLLWLASGLNFMMTGKAEMPVAPVAPEAPKV
jgi:small neutral amino acid transporter SnatA (MarC family)